MSDNRDQRVSAFVTQLVDAAPPPPPFPDVATYEVPAPRPGRWVVLAAVTALIAGTLGVVAVTRDDSDSPPADDVVAVPPSSTAIAYAGPDGLYVTGGTSAPRRVVEGAVTRPRWSPDGEYLAFEQDGSAVVADADGSATRTVATADKFAWSPTEPWLAVLRGQHVVVFDAAGQELWTSLGVIEHDVFDFAWSTGGTELAVTSRTADQGAVGTLFLVAVDTGTTSELEVTRPPGSLANFLLHLAGWSSDDSSVLVWFAEGGSGGNDGLFLYALERADGSLVPLGHTLLEESWVRPSPAGGVIAIVESTGRMVGDTRQLRLCQTDGSCADVVEGEVDSVEPAWTADGSRLAFVRNDATRDPNAWFENEQPHWERRYAERELWVTDVGGGEPRAIPAAGRGVGAPAWTADGLIVYAREGRLWRIDPDAPVPVEVGELSSRAAEIEAAVYDQVDQQGVGIEDLFAVAPAPVAPPETVTITTSAQFPSAELTGSFLDVAAGGPGLVAVTETGAILLSADGRSWRAADFMFDAEVGVYGLANTSRGLVAWAYPGVFFESVDGEAWTRVDAATDAFELGYVNGLVELNGRFVAVGSVDIPTNTRTHAGHARAWVSDDLSEWEYVDFEHDSFADVVVAGNEVVAIDGQGAWTSPDGAKWSRVPDVRLPRAQLLAATDSGFIASDIGGEAEVATWTSTDARIWTKSFAPIDGGDQAQVTGIVVLGEELIAVGSDPNGPAVWTSPVDDVAWQQVR